MAISDVPGLTWGVVPALAQNGVKYISNGPNANPGQHGRRPHRLRPRAMGTQSVLLAVAVRPREGAVLGRAGRLLDRPWLPRSITAALPVLFRRLEEGKYPYDIVQLRWTKGDNGPPDEGVMDAVREWNAKHAYPRLIIATTSEAFHAFEKRYGDKLPTYRGDLTPYWEDGAASGARETALNRHSADRLLQAETLWALLGRGGFPAADFAAAWKNVALWSEHTWGAYNSISEPDLPFVKTQWKFKQAYALDADRQSRKLLEKALARAARRAGTDRAVDVFNTVSWPRTELVTLPKETEGRRREGRAGAAVPSQRL